MHSFYIDQTEITNNEYRQFVHWVRDSIARTLLAENFDEETFMVTEKDGELLDEPYLNWDVEIPNGMMTKLLSQKHFMICIFQKKNELWDKKVLIRVFGSTNIHG